MGTQRTSVVIANGASQSGEIDCSGLDILGIILPSGWTAAAVTFLAAVREDQAGNADTFVPIYDDAGTELTIASANAVAGRFIALRPDIAPLTRGPWRIKLRSGVAATPVNQGAARTIIVVLGHIN
jgi:hypothetical protein